METPATWCPDPPQPVERQTRGQYAGCDPVNSQHVGMRRLLITGLIRSLLIGGFSDPSQILDPVLRSYIWKPGDDTGVLIESAHRFDAASLNKRPAVIVKPNAAKYSRVTIGDQAGQDAVGNRHYVKWWRGSHTVFCLHGNGASAEALSVEVERLLTENGPLIVQHLGLDVFQTVDLGDIGELEESTENSAVPVTVAWAFKSAWSLKQIAPAIKTIRPDLNAV